MNDNKQLLKLLLSTRCILLVCGISIIAGLVLTYIGIHGWDDTFRYHHSQWLLSVYHLKDYVGGEYPHLRSYSAIPMELVLALITECVLPFLHDPYWIRHTFVFAAFPFSLYILFVVLLRSGYGVPTGLIAVTGMMSIIRLGGHALWNVKDAPHALVHLLVILLLWTGLLNVQEMIKKQKPPPYTLLIGMGVLSVMPFLFRRPNISQIALLFPTMIVLALSYKSLSWRNRTIMVGLPVLSAMVTLVVFYPPIIKSGLGVVVNSIQTTANFGWGGYVRLFGRTFFSQNLPWWYAFAWLPVIATSTVILLSAVGLVFSVMFKGKQKSETLSLSLSLRRYQWSWTLQTWLWIQVCAVWFAVLFLKPTLYDEERHLLFIYPPVFLLGLLGLRYLKANIQYALAAIMFVTAMAAYVHWGQYAYIYKSTLIGNRNSFAFMGDYKKLCYARGVDALARIAPSPSLVSVDGFTVNLARIQYDRLRYSPVMSWRYPDLPQLQFASWRPKATPFYVITSNRVGSEFFTVRREIKEGKAEFIWGERFPTGEQGCIIARYN